MYLIPSRRRSRQTDENPVPQSPPSRPPPFPLGRTYLSLLRLMTKQVDALFNFLMFRFTIWVHRPTPGMHLQVGVSPAVGRSSCSCLFVCFWSCHPLPPKLPAFYSIATFGAGWLSVVGSRVGWACQKVRKTRSSNSKECSHGLVALVCSPLGSFDAWIPGDHQEFIIACRSQQMRRVIPRPLKIQTNERP